MKTIPLTKGLVTLVDNDDFDWLSQFRWCASKNSTSGPYAARGVRVPGTNTTRLVMMHRVIMSAEPGIQVDHINRNPLDNQRANLRLATAGQNYANGSRGLPKSGFRGVECQSSGTNKKFFVRGLIDGKRVYLGSFATAKEAAKVASEHRLQRFGEFAAPEFLVR